MKKVTQKIHFIVRLNTTKNKEIYKKPGSTIISPYIYYRNKFNTILNIYNYIFC